MRALYATRLGGDAPLDNLEFGDRPAPVPGPGEVRVRVQVCGVCRTDLHPVTFCGECDGCRGGDPMLCRKFMMLSDGSVEGSFAEFVVAPAGNAVRKPASLSFE